MLTATVVLVQAIVGTLTPDTDHEPSAAELDAIRQCYLRSGLDVV